MSGRRNSGQRPSSLDYLFGKSEEVGQDDDQSKVCSPSVRNSGGGQSSLGYLFGTANDLGQRSNKESKQLSTPPVCIPPYGTDNMKENSPEKSLAPPSKKDDHNSSPKSYVYHKVDGVLMTGRPSTRVSSVPGGDSSVGYLFGDK